ncbi:DcaP family trimeric outer membrane transporter [Billgrantia antri]|uniref:Porin n=1 Tax=Billgrantia antri TaxID=2846777 RepID=A0ABS6ZIE5_9GAMM|nr:DcaP family trimeric outer membrane transporter [Halomonas antri]MBW6389830.1 porin [Halomonas antri]
MAFRVSTGLTALAIATMSMPAIAQDDTIDQLRLQMQEMQRQIKRLESQQAQAQQQEAEAREALAANVVTGGDTPGSFKVPGTDTSVQIGGYVRLDTIYDLDQDLGDSLFVEGIDTSEGSSNASFRAHARQSRLFFKTSTPTAFGPATTHLEGDFFGGGGNEVFSNSRGFRLRHAYGEWNGLLAGQTWSNFMQFAAYPSTVDFDGPVGVSFIRQAQLRYTLPLGASALSFSAENAEATGFSGSRDSAPDLTARYRWGGDNATIETAAVVRRLKVDEGAANDSATGYGLMLAGNIGVGPDTTLMAGAIFGDGIGRYLYTASGSSDGDEGIGAAFVVADGNLETIEAYGFNVAVAQQWNDKFSSSLSYGQVRGDRPGDLFPESTRKLESIHFSHFYRVTEPVTLGFEVSHGRKELQSRESGDNTRLQFSAQYSF